MIGIRVTHPLSDGIVAELDGNYFAFDPRETRFADVEADYYASIRECTFHTVCNQFLDKPGYLGGSASLEIAYAMCFGKPVMALHTLTPNSSVDPFVADFIASRSDIVWTCDVLGESDDSLINTVLQLAAVVPVSYAISEPDRSQIFDRVSGFLGSLDIS